MTTQTIKSIPEMEQEVLKFWKSGKIFEKSVAKNPESNSFVFYDGPPFISGLPHYGHFLGSTAKDVIPRFQTMRGKRVERVWGWDAHGLTVENKVQARLGIKNRREIEAFGLDKFTQECYKYTSEVSSEWDWYIDRLGRWVDMENAYRTTDQKYMESVMWVFKQLYDKGLIYEGVRTSLYCTTCGTPVSNFEVAMDNSYKDVEDPAITVKFLVTSSGEFEGVNILAWTTTPWTIPSNRALVLVENENYSVVESAGQTYVAAEKRLEDVFEGMDYRVLKAVKGSQLIGLTYQPPFEFFSSIDGEYKVYAFEGMANVDEGTGIVHSAPGFGLVDTEMGRHYGLTIMMTVDNEGKFIAGDNGKNPFEGQYFSKANDGIRADLSLRNLLFKDETIVHSFPYHDRCNTLLIQKAQNSWFIDVQSFKKDLLKNNEGINWVPAHLKEGRFKQVLEAAPDWCISRNRFWATPTPVWESEDGERIVVSSIEEIERLSGQKVSDLHRPYIDDVVFVKGGKTYKRRTEVLDSWFEAASMPYAQFHYPFENKEKFEKNFPGDYIVEYIAQVRAWFNVMHTISTALFNKASFVNVITTGTMAGNDGRKMSKTYGNYTDSKEVIETIGGDALRLYLMNSPLMVGENANFDEVELKNKSRNVLNPLLNSAKFFVLYADLYNWHEDRQVHSKNILDLWILSRLNQMVSLVETNLNSYLIPPATDAVEKFVDDLSRWYVRRSRDRINSGDEEALATLFKVLDVFSKASAPIIPFMSETIYGWLKKYKDKNAESVHLEDFPKVDKFNLEILSQMDLARDVVSQGHSFRTENKVGVRQPLKKALITSNTSLSEELVELVKDELNVKELEFNLQPDVRDLTVVLDLNITDDLKQEGYAREMIRTFQGLRKDLGLSVSDKIEALYEETDETRKAVSSHSEEIKKKIGAVSLKPGAKYEISKAA